MSTVTELPRPLIALSGVRRSYRVGDETVHALRDATLNIRQGEQVAVVGASGSGKSTLLGIVGLLDQPSHGVYRFDGEDVTRLDADRQAIVRRRSVGFVFQQFHLVPSMTAHQNVELPLRYQRLTRSERAERVEVALAAVGLFGRRGHQPAQLSGGECQRVAIARALVSRPRLLLADEPTGALDSATGLIVMNLIRSLAAESGTTLLLITHDRPLAAGFARCVQLSDGRIVGDGALARHVGEPCTT